MFHKKGTFRPVSCDAALISLIGQLMKASLISICKEKSIFHFPVWCGCGSVCIPPSLVVSAGK